MVAIHNRALSGGEIQQNFDAGAGNISTLRFDLAATLGAPGYIDMQFAELDGESYLFAQPVLVTDARRVRVKNIRIAVNDVTRRSTPRYSGAWTSLRCKRAGAFAPGCGDTDGPGSGMDQFRLEFEMLGDQAGLAEPVAPPAPPPPLRTCRNPMRASARSPRSTTPCPCLTGIDRESQCRTRPLRRAARFAAANFRHPGFRFGPADCGSAPRQNLLRRGRH